MLASAAENAANDRRKLVVWVLWTLLQDLHHLAVILALKSIESKESVKCPT